MNDNESDLLRALAIVRGKKEKARLAAGRQVRKANVECENDHARATAKIVKAISFRLWPTAFA